MLYQLSDLHLLDDPSQMYRGVDVYQRFDACIDYLTTVVSPDDVLVLTGDLCQFGHSRGYSYIVGQVKALGIPVFWLPGNHDERAKMGSLDTVAAAGVLGCDHSVYDLANNWRLILLDSSHFPDGKGSGAVSEDALDRLSHQLAVSAEKHILIAIHHHFLPVASLWQDEIMLANAQKFKRVLVAAGRPLKVICGHVHQHHHLTHANIELVTAPAVAAQFKAFCATPVLEDDLERTGPGLMEYQLASNGDWVFRSIFLAL